MRDSTTPVLANSGKHQLLSPENAMARARRGENTIECCNRDIAASMQEQAQGLDQQERLRWLQEGAPERQCGGLYRAAGEGCALVLQGTSGGGGEQGNGARAVPTGSCGCTAGLRLPPVTSSARRQAAEQHTAKCSAAAAAPPPSAVAAAPLCSSAGSHSSSGRGSRGSRLDSRKSTGCTCREGSKRHRRTPYLPDEKGRGEGLAGGASCGPVFGLL